MLTFTLIIMLLRRNTTGTYWNSSMVRNLFLTQFENDIANVDLIYTFLKDSVGPNLLIDDTTGSIPQLRELSVIVDPIRFRQVRTVISKCTKVWLHETNSCYKSEYTSSTKETGDICEDIAEADKPDWCTFKTSAQSGINSLQTYDGDGYIQDVPGVTVLSDWQTMIDEMESLQYFNASVRAFFLTFSLYNPSQDKFVSTEMLIELSNTGLVSPTHINVRSFRANVFQTSEEKGVRATEIFRLLTIFYIAFFQIGVKIYRLSSWKLVFLFKNFLKLIIDSLIIITILTNFVLIHLASDETPDEILNSSKYIDMVYKGVLYDQIFILESIILFLLVLKILHVMTIVKSVRIISKSISYAFKQVLTYMLIILPLVIAFTLIGMGIYGPFLNEYSTFANSFVSVLFFSVGQSNTTELMKFNSVWTVIYVVIVTMIIIYLLISSFVAVYYTDAYVTTIMSEGYPENEFAQASNAPKPGQKTSKWTVRDAVVWMLDLLPNRWLLKMGVITQKDIDIQIEEKRKHKLNYSDEDEDYEYEQTNMAADDG